MRFWDASAVLPLLVDEPGTAAMVALQVEDPAAAVWWLTPVECWSALGRLERERRLTEDGVTAAARLLAEAARRGTEGPPTDRARGPARPSTASAAPACRHRAAE